MTKILEYPPEYLLTDQSLAKFLDEIKELLKGRVIACYLFGSCATKTFRPDSDIDLLLVADCSLPFVQRPFQFGDLLDVFPRMDFFVYTEAEFSRLINDSSNGFWRIIRETMLKIL